MRRTWQYSYSRAEVLVLLDEIDRLNARVSELEAEATDPEHVVGRYIDLGLDLAESFRVDL
jgi:hypothetical protein